MSPIIVLLLAPALSRFVLAAKEVPMVHVQAVAADPVYLPCDISIRPEKPDSHSQPDQVLLVLWYREDLGTPIYSVDAREREWKQAERWSDEHVFSNRAYFMPEKHPAELGVDHVRDSDAGIYRCRVDFRIAQTRNSKVNLTVIVPPHRIAIVDENGVEKKDFVGPYEEGQDIRLTCQVYGGKPKPEVSWHRGNDLLSSESEAVPLSSGNYVQNQLVLRNLARSDLRSELTCIASNNNRTTPQVSTVHLDMNFKPLDVKILASSQPLSAGRRYDLLCQSTGSRPPAKITWWKNGQRLDRTKETTSSDGNTTTSTLSFVASKEDDGKNLSCQAENTVVSSETLHDYWTLHIHYVPETTLTLGKSLDPNAIQEGADVYFDCMVKAEPTVYKVEWRHNGRLLNHNVQQGIIISNQSLVLQGVSRHSAGNYTCVGFNTEGDGESNAFYLNVMFAPSCKPNQTRVHGVAKQEKANISCEVDSNPPEVTFRWTFNNSAESMDVARTRIEGHGTSSVVTYTPVTEMDYGTLLCWATNRIGPQRVPCVYHIIAAGKPDQVHNCTISNTSMTSFSLRCVEGFNGGLPQSFLAQVTDTLSQELLYNLSSAVPYFAVHGLAPGHMYQAAVFAMNAKGFSEPAFMHASTLRLPEKQLTSEKERPRHGFRLTPVMSVVIGVVGSLFVVACVVAGLLRLQCSRNEGRRKRHKMEGQRPGSADKGPGGQSPLGKADLPLSADSDERNPDIIPQPAQGLDEDEHEFLRKRQMVSTIETRTSPSRSLLQHATGPYPGYCTLRNGGLPLQDLSNIPTKPPPPMVGESMYPGGGCSLPRGWGVGGRGGYQGRAPPPAPLPEATPDSAPETPLMLNKRESTV